MTNLNLLEHFLLLKNNSRVVQVGSTVVVVYSDLGLFMSKDSKWIFAPSSEKRLTHGLFVSL